MSSVALFVDGNRIELHRADPDIQVDNPHPARNDAGGEVRVKAYWKRGHLSPMEWDAAREWAEGEPLALEAIEAGEVYGIKMEADITGYGTAGSKPIW